MRKARSRPPPPPDQRPRPPRLDSAGSGVRTRQILSLHYSVRQERKDDVDAVDAMWCSEREGIERATAILIPLWSIHPCIHQLCAIFDHALSIGTPVWSRTSRFLNRRRPGAICIRPRVPFEEHRLNCCRRANARSARPRDAIPIPLQNAEVIVIRMLGLFLPSARQ